MQVSLMHLDIDRRRRTFPNLALMKLSQYHKLRGDSVSLNFPLLRPDVVYASCVFSWNSSAIVSVPSNADVGGSGIDLTKQLSPEIEHSMPDYSLYPDLDFSMGFTSRGCIRRCPWCIVPEKEGNIRSNARIYEFWNPAHRKIVLLDNNILAAPNCQQTMEDLICENLEVDFNQGLDIRLLNNKNIDYLKRVKTKQLRFAFDDIRYEKAVREGIRLLTEAGIPSRKLSFYVLVGFGDDRCDIERMKLLQSWNVDVYPMLYKDRNGKEPRIDTEWLQDIFWHGSRQNLRKFLRASGRLY